MLLVPGVNRNGCLVYPVGAQEYAVLLRCFLLNRRHALESGLGQFTLLLHAGAVCLCVEANNLRSPRPDAFDLLIADC